MRSVSWGHSAPSATTSARVVTSSPPPPVDSSAPSATPFGGMSPWAECVHEALLSHNPLGSWASTAGLAWLNLTMPPDHPLVAHDRGEVAWQKRAALTPGSPRKPLSLK